MPNNHKEQASLEKLKQILETLTEEVSPLFPDDSAQLSSWRRSLEAVSESLQDQTLRIAVVGPVKSGKSTFINSMQGRDLLKRALESLPPLSPAFVWARRRRGGLKSSPGKK